MTHDKALSLLAQMVSIGLICRVNTKDGQTFYVEAAKPSTGKWSKLS